MRISLIFLVFFSVSSVPAQVPEWFIKLDKIDVLGSTRQDIETLLLLNKVHNEQTLEFYTIVQYDTKDGDLEVYYSNGRCSENKKSIWDVNKNIALKVFFRPAFEVVPSKLKIKLKKFQQETSDDNPNIMYSDEKTGRKYTLQFGKIRFIELFPTIEQNNKLYCPNN